MIKDWYSEFQYVDETDLTDFTNEKAVKGKYGDGSDVLITHFTGLVKRDAFAVGCAMMIDYGTSIPNPETNKEFPAPTYCLTCVYSANNVHEQPINEYAKKGSEAGSKCKIKSVKYPGLCGVGEVYKNALSDELMKKISTSRDSFKDFYVKESNAPKVFEYHSEPNSYTKLKLDNKPEGGKAPAGGKNSQNK